MTAPVAGRRTALGLAAVVLTLLLLPLLLNVLRGGARGVGFDPRTEGSQLLFAATFPPSVSTEPLSGRLLIIVSKDASVEPRLQVGVGPSAPQVFGVDVRGWRPGRPLEVTDAEAGFPLPSLRYLRPGFYQVQGVLHLYEPFDLPSGQTVLLPLESGEGQRWNLKPGNLLSGPVGVRLDARSDDVIRVDLARTIPPLPSATDTESVKHVRFRSETLSAFWGREVFLEATVLLPQGWSETPGARYPLLLLRGAAPAPETAPWGGADTPRLILVVPGDANPYFETAHGVNSENLGPYGDALTYELIPEIERRFRGVGEAWARSLVGAFSGGWAAMATQILYPDEYNGAWAVCPDHVDFRALAGVDLYQATNIYTDGAAGEAGADGSGATVRPLARENRLELVIGNRGRSGGRWDGWQAVYSPRGMDGYPRSAWAKRTGRIDPEVVASWRERYDLRHILERDWSTLGPALAGKLHVHAANDSASHAVQLLDRFLEGTGDARYQGVVTSGEPGCERTDAGGAPGAGVALAQRFLPEIALHFVRSAPAGADTTSWRF